jgi:vacuolar-type H+-ATPase subunit I/STV1
MRESMRRPFVWVFFALGGVVLAAVLAFLFGLIVMALWNWLMPGIFGIRAISYWEAWGLVLLAHILFKAGGYRNRGPGHHDSARNEEWKERFRRRFKDRFPGREGSEAGRQGASGEGAESPEGRAPADGGGLR